MKQILIIITFFMTLYSCRAQENSQELYSNNVGEIAFDEKIDDASFKVDDDLILFFEPVYEGEKPAIVNHFKEKYKSHGFEKVNGYVTIRFYVNSEGKTGKFRMETMDFDYKKKEFDKRFSNQILKLTKELKGWQSLQMQTKIYGYYCYLNFKIINGEIKEITP